MINPVTATDRETTPVNKKRPVECQETDSNNKATLVDIDELFKTVAVDRQKMTGKSFITCQKINSSTEGACNE